MVGMVNVKVRAYETHYVLTSIVKRDCTRVPGFRLRQRSCSRLSAYLGGLRSATVWHFTAQQGVLSLYIFVPIWIKHFSSM